MVVWRKYPIAPPNHLATRGNKEFEFWGERLIGGEIVFYCFLSKRIKRVFAQFRIIQFLLFLINDLNSNFNKQSMCDPINLYLNLQIVKINLI